MFNAWTYLINTIARTSAFLSLNNGDKNNSNMQNYKISHHLMKENHLIMLNKDKIRHKMLGYPDDIRLC